MAKRAFDILFSICFLLVLWPVYLIVAIVIKCTSPGPVIYKANRVGKNGELFVCYKFRSMHVDSGAVHITTLSNDARIYPFGKFLRATKIDEFPQIINILQGKMSVVGPRPEDEANAALVYKGEFRHLTDVKPGLTSPGSIYDYTHGELFEDEQSYSDIFLPKKLSLELYYVRHCGFWYDMALILRTAWTILLKIFGKKNFNEPKEMKKFEVERNLQNV